MKLTPEQTAQVAQWVRDGASLADVQRRLESECAVRLTYMDVRFLVDDLQLELANNGPKFSEPKIPVAPSGEPGKVSVRLDRVTRPDALVSGHVTFSDGVSAQWFLDQMGRLSLNPAQSGYRPSEADVQSFQKELRSLIEKSGMY